MRDELDDDVDAVEPDDGPAGDEVADAAVDRPDGVTLEADVRLLIEAFDVAPQRADWERVLARTEATFRNEATR